MQFNRHGILRYGLNYQEDLENYKNYLGFMSTVIRKLYGFSESQKLL